MHPGAPTYPHLVHVLVHAFTSAKPLRNRAASATPPPWRTFEPWQPVSSGLRRSASALPRSTAKAGSCARWAPPAASPSGAAS